VATGLAAAICCTLAAGAVALETEVTVLCPFTMDLEVLDTVADFFTCKGADFLAGAAGATFFAAGLAILLAAGAFFAGLLPDEWADFGAAFLAGAIFLTFTVFLAGFAAFFLVAIQLGFFSDEHF
jgi:hypothetical protein